MAKQSLGGWADDVAQAFRSAGPNVDEKAMFGGRAFLVDGRLMGHVELRTDSLRVLFRLPEAQRAELEARTHYDPGGPLPALMIVTAEDRDFACALVPHAYRLATLRAVPPRPSKRR